MQAKDYVGMFKLDQENYQFKREEFIQKLGEDFLEECQKNPKDVNPLTGVIYYTRFKAIVKTFETKFHAISDLCLRPLTPKLWNAFYATQVVRLRKEWFPDRQKEIEKGRLNSIINHEARDKNSRQGKKGYRNH